MSTPPFFYEEWGRFLLSFTFFHTFYIQFTESVMIQMRYGIGYKGSKNKWADHILKVLPDGKRFVDLFGGGFAMSHAALLSGKYEQVYYNDINAQLVQLVKDAIDGKYSYDVFHPEWINREEFHQKKDTDAYIKYCWSFGNDGCNYLFGKDREEWKRQGFEFVVNKVPFEGVTPKGETITERRKEWRQLMKSFEKRGDLESLERLQSLERLERLQSLERLERLQSLESLERLERLSFHTHDYRDYVYQPGDVVYCDIPYDVRYKNGEYGDGFDHKAFYDWAASRPYPVYISSYNIDDDRFKCIWEKEGLSIFNSNGPSRCTERIYTQR